MLHDKDIREPLFDFMDETYGKVRIIEEKTIGCSRADVVMVTEDSLYGIEIKSDADTYKRLKTQVKDYDKYYDYNYIVVGSTHALHVENYVPGHWGIVSVEEIDGTLDFYILRKSGPNPKMVWKKKLEILWRPELALLQELNMMPKYKEKSKAFVVEKIAERIENQKIDANVFMKQMCELLFERDYNTVEQLKEDFRDKEIRRIRELERDPETFMELERKREIARQNFGHTRKKRRRRR